MLDRENIETAEVDYKTAISFLRKESITLPESKKGYVLVSFQNQALGWVKNLGNRTNNLYPQEWRIRMKIDCDDRMKVSGDAGIINTTGIKNI